MSIIVVSLLTFIGCLGGAYLLYAGISGEGISFSGKSARNVFKIKRELECMLREYIDYCFDGNSTDMKTSIREITDVSKLSSYMFLAEILVNYIDEETGDKKKRYIQVYFNSHIPYSEISVFSNYLLTSGYSFEEECDDFESFLLGRYSYLKFLKKYKMNRIEERYMDIPFNLEVCKKEAKLSEMISDFIYDIKNDIIEASKLSNEIDDIDISVSISELCENTDLFIDNIGKEDNKEKFISLSEHYKESVRNIVKSLKDFKNLKNKDSLEEEKEMELQNKIDEEVNNCFNLSKM